MSCDCGEFTKLIIDGSDIEQEIQTIVGNKVEIKTADEIRKERNWFVTKCADSIVSEPYYCDEDEYDQIMADLVTKARISETNKEKKESLEGLGAYVFDNIDGMKVVKRNLRGTSEEIDLLVSNESDETFFKMLGSPFMVECRNTESAFSSKDARDFIGKIESLGLNGGIIISRKGITGKLDRDAKSYLREKRKDGISVIPLELRDISNIADGASPLKIMKKKYYDLFPI
ncbi:hypothetical protein [Methanococcoides sp. AM1]|uniref:hypothetical protein n=1 Tax=Methanococcoides sp. AM1 TaxID=1201011 RepID=UPI001083288D|nr:hypothetical protein [Methanococcoides sp. AM1]